MKRGRRVKIIISSLVVLFFLSFGIVYAVLNQRKEEEDVLGATNDESILEGVESIFGIPYIVSTPPIEVKEGEVYEYYPRIEDADSEINTLSIELVDGPGWLFVRDMMVTGEVPYGIEGTYEYTIRVSDGTNSSSQKNYILVTKTSE